MSSKPEHVKLLEQWMKSYKPEELFDTEGKLFPEIAALAPIGQQRMGDNHHANGGILLRNLKIPNFRNYAVEVKNPGTTTTEATRVLGKFLADILKLNEKSQNFRIFGPDETASNRLGDVFQATDRTWTAEILPEDEQLSPDGRVMEILSEHTCQGWLEGYLLTGRHGIFSCYKAFIHIIDSMFNQHAKWLKTTRHISWRKPVASLNYLLTSHVWRQDHKDFDSIFTTDKPIIFAFHGYPWSIHRLTYRLTNHKNLHVRGYKEEGTTTTPFDMVVLNDLDRFHLTIDAIDRVPQLGAKAAYVKQMLEDKPIDRKHYVSEYGEDMAEVRDWKWKYYRGSATGKTAIGTQQDNASSTPSLAGEEGAARK
jgi:phosphoketolase